MPDPCDDFLGIVDRSVIRALLNDRGTEWPLAAPGFGVLDQRIVADSFTYGRLVQRGVLNRPDQPIGVTLGWQKDRDAAAKEQRTMMRRLVIVAIEQHEIVLGDEIRKNNFVRCSIEHEIGAKLDGSLAMVRSSRKRSP